MDRTVYPDPLLGEVSEGVAMIRIDIDLPAGRAIAERYRVFQYPTLIYLAPDGREILRWAGPLGLRDTRLNLGQVGLPSAGRAAIEAERARRPRDIATQVRALLWYAWRGEVERVRAVVDTLEHALAGSPRAASDGALLQLGLGKAEEIAGRSERALAAYRRAFALEPEGAFAWRAWLGVSSCLEARGDGVAAEAAAREAQARHGAPWLSARVARLGLARRSPALPTPPGIDPR
jgi:tetratricopeptide (TPR) repeat protein